MELTADAMDEPAWEAMDETLRSNARLVLETIVARFDGVLVGPGRLARHLVEHQAIGHRSALEALAALVAHGLLDQRDADTTPVFWVPDRLIRHQLPQHARPPPRRRNGTPAARAQLSN